MGNGKISPTMTQAEGPHVIANIEMLIHMNAIIAAVAAELGFDPLPAVTPTIPTMYCEITIPVPPQSRILRRPNFSISQKETGVEHTVVYIRVSTALLGLETWGGDKPRECSRKQISRLIRSSKDGRKGSEKY